MRDMQRFLITLLLAFSIITLGSPLEISSVDYLRRGVKIEPGVPPDIDLVGYDENPFAESMSTMSPMDGLDWTVTCRLDTGAVDIVFVIDSSGSMGGTISNVRAAVGGLISALDAAGYDYMLGGITYADGRNIWDFDGGTPGNQMTNNAALFTGGVWLGGVGASGGADGPEQSLDAIADAISDYEWRPEALHIVIGFTDASYCQIGDGCTGYCNPGTGTFGMPAAQTDAGVASLIASTGTVVFWASPTSVYASCGTFTSPVPASPYGGTGHLGWYQYFCHVSGGQWYNLYATSWSDIFDDVADLINTFEAIFINVTNTTGSTINPVTAFLNPGACISVLSSNPISTSIGPGASHNFQWQIDYDETCSGADLCFTIAVSGGGYADTAFGCMYMEDCQCAGPLPTTITPNPCGVWTACEYQEIVIEFEDDDVGTNPHSIQLMVDGVLYSYPTYMTWDPISTTVGRLTFTPPTPWIHGTCINWHVVRADDWSGCPVVGDGACSFCVDLEPPEELDWTPMCGTLLDDTLVTIQVGLEDNEAGIDILSLYFTVNGTAFSLGGGPPSVDWTGTTTSGYLELHGTLRQMGLDMADSAVVCVHACDRVSSTYCGPNCEEYCCVFYLNQPPMAEFVYPDEETWSACDPPIITLHLWDDLGADVNPSSVILEVNGLGYSEADAWMTVTTDSIIFNPPVGTYFDGDTIRVCLVALSDDAGATSEVIPICRTFFLDYTPPVVFDIFPPPDTTLLALPDSMSFCIYDSLSGLNPAAFHFIVQDDFYGGTVITDEVNCFSAALMDSMCIAYGELCTISVCVYAEDLPDYCDAHVLDTCWQFYLERSGPVPDIVFPMPNTWSACTDSGIIMEITEVMGPVDSTTIVFRVERAGLPPEIYRCSDAALMWLEDENLLWFKPDASYWRDGDTIFACLDSVSDVYGTPSAVTPLCWTFYTDFTPPVFWDIWPPMDTLIADATPTMSVYLYDSLSGVSPLDIFATISVNGEEADTFEISAGVRWDEPTRLFEIIPSLAGIAFSDSDSVVICVHAFDTPDYCGPNWGDTCWAFVVSLSGPVPQWVQYAPESWVACDSFEQFASMTITDPDGVDPTSILITVNGDTFAVDSFQVEYVNDTLTFDPANPSDFWHDNDSVEICLIAAVDSLGNTFSGPYCWWWRMDLSPPVFWDEIPVDGALLNDSTAAISIYTFDSLSGLDPSCIEITIYDTLVISAGYSGFVFDTATGMIYFNPATSGLYWEDWDTVNICIKACDLPDYCDPNVGEFCWEFSVHLRGPEAEIVTPQPGEITSCYDQCIVINMWDDDAGVDPTTIELIVDGVSYGVDGSALIYEATATETTLTFCPIPAGIAWSDSQEVCVQLVAADDTLGNPLQTPLDWCFWVDLMPPVVEDFTAGAGTVCGDTIFTTRPSISFNLWDNLSGVDTARMEITLDDTLVYYWGDPGITAAGGVFTVNTSMLDPMPFYMGGDSARICIYVEDTTDLCEDNSAIYCCKFYIMPGGPAPNWIRPLPNTWSACVDTEHVYLEIFDDDGVVDTSIIVTVNRSASSPSPGTTTLYYDSPGVAWTEPYFRYDPAMKFADPETVHVCIMQAWDPVFNPMSPESLCWTFMMDQTPPALSGETPVDGAIVATRHPTVEFNVEDIQSGLDHVSVDMTVTGSIVGTHVFDLGHASLDTVHTGFGVDVTWYPELADISFKGGENVEICVYAHDGPDYCDYNELLECWEFSIETGGPLAEIRRVWPDSISSCDPEYVLIHLWDDNGVVDSTIQLEVNGVVYDYPDRMTYDHGTEILEFFPVPPFEPVDIITVRLLAAEDSLGNPLDTTAYLDWTFYVDRVPPEVLSAVPEGDIFSTVPIFNIEVYDTLAGVNPASIILTIDGVDYSVGDPGVSWASSGLEGTIGFDPASAIPPLRWFGGDTVEWCVEMVDLADDYLVPDGCEPNFFDTCMTFQVVPGGPVGVILNPNEGYYVACDPFVINMRLTDSEDDALIEDSIEVVISRSTWGLEDTIVFTLDSTELTYDPVTGGMVYDPIPPFADAETVFIAITAAMDTLFNGLEEGDEVTFYMDFSPPYITDISPIPSSMISEIEPLIIVGLHDDMSGVDPSSLILTVDGVDYDLTSAGIDWSGVSEEITLDPTDIGLRWWGGDTVDVCIYAYDSPDTCGPNEMDSCWQFYIAPGGPVATPINPADSAISACDPEFIELTIEDPDGIDDTTVVVSMYRSGPSSPPATTVYRIGDAGVTWVYPTLRIDPIVPFADAETVTVCVDSAADPIGNELVNPQCWDFFMDLSVYAAWGFVPADEDTVRTRRPVIEFSVWDSISGIDTSTFRITIDHTNTFDLNDAPCVIYDPATGHVTINPVDCGLQWTGGDLVLVELWGEDMPTACDPNDTSYSWSFAVAPGGPEATLINPQPGWYCSCDPQGIEILLWDEDGVNESTIRLWVDGVEYTTDDPELTYYSTDSLLYFEPDPNFVNGQVVLVELTEADDMLGNELVSPLSWSFRMDLEPPSVNFLEPSVYMTRNREQPISFTLMEDGSGIDESSFELVIREHGNMHVYDYTDVDWSVAVTGPSGEIRTVDVTYYPAVHGVEFTSGDSVFVSVYLYDSPDTCAPNEFADSMQFIIEPDVECLVFPNPFTPNNDDINDLAVFNYPFMFSEKAELAIYTVRNVEVYRAEIDMVDRDIVEFGPRSWDGKDSQGKLLPDGLYIYLIIQDGEVVCNGTVVLAR